MNNEKGCATGIGQDIKWLLESIAEKEKLKDYAIKIDNDDMNGDGYVGLITGITITGKDKQGIKRITNLILKSAPQNDSLRSEIPISTVFGREIYAYNIVFPMFRNFELEKGLTPTSLSAKFYNSQMKYKSETLVLENLKSCGFRLHDTKIYMNDEHVRLVAEQYGRFHALSLGLRQQRPEEFKQVIGSMDDFYSKFMKNTGFVAVFKQQCIKAQNAFHPESHGIELKVYQKFIHEMEHFFDDIESCVDQYSVALHGDCWMNNMMFKYGDSAHPERPTHVYFLDFQMMRVGSPMLDLAYFFYTSSSNEILNNYRHYLNVYYDSLETHLRKLGGNAVIQYPFSVMEEQWKRFAKLGLIISLTATYAMLTDKSQRRNLNDIIESGQSLTTLFDYKLDSIDQYYKRARNIILHFINNDLI